MIKCPACGRKKGLKCIFSNIYTLVLFYLSSPILFIWILKNIVFSKKKENTNTSHIPKHKTSFIALISNRIKNHCIYYDINIIYENWIIQIESEIVKNPLEVDRYKEYILIKDNAVIVSENIVSIVSNFLEDQQSIPDLLYGSYDYLIDGKRQNPEFLMNWNKFLFYSYDYLGPILLVKKEFYNETNISNLSFQDQKSILVIECIKQKKDIQNIAAIVSHKVDKENNLVRNSIIIDYLNTIYPYYFKFSNNSFLQVANNIKDQVSIIIPTKDNLKLLKECIESIINKTENVNYEIIVVDNNSENEETIKYFDYLSNFSFISVLKYNNIFNFSAINNYAVNFAKGEYICFLNNDTTVISKKWLHYMLSYASIDEVGAVGAKLLYPNNTIQHAGITFGLSGIAGHRYRNMPDNLNDYNINSVQEVSAVTAACMCIKKTKFIEAGMFNENEFTVAMNDIDLCVKLSNLGYINIYEPNAQLYHHESISRGSDFSFKNSKRYRKECSTILKKWKNTLSNDKYYNKYLTKEREDHRISL
jgi:O-antigen biosynthesis protein